VIEHEITHHSIDGNITIEIHDEKLNALLRRRGCFEIFDPDLNGYVDFFTGTTPSMPGSHYQVVRVLKTLGNLKRYNFIELLFGLPRKEEEYKGGYLF